MHLVKIICASIQMHAYSLKRVKYSIKAVKLIYLHNYLNRVSYLMLYVHQRNSAITYIAMQWGNYFKLQLISKYNWWENTWQNYFQKLIYSTMLVEYSIGRQKWILICNIFCHHVCNYTITTVIVGQQISILYEAFNYLCIHSYIHI